MRLLKLLSVIVVGVLCVSCSGTPTAPVSQPVNVVVPVAPVTPIVVPTLPTVRLVGEAIGVESEPVPFPTAVDLASASNASAQAADGKVTFGAMVTFAPSISMQWITWDFGDGSIYRYGCNSPSGATKLCDTLQRGLTPTHTYYRKPDGCVASPFTAVITAETDAGSVSASTLVTIQQHPSCGKK